MFVEMRHQSYIVRCKIQEIKTMVSVKILTLVLLTYVMQVV